MTDAAAEADLEEVMKKEDGIDNEKDLALPEELLCKEFIEKPNALDEDFTLDEEIDGIDALIVDDSKSGLGKGDTSERHNVVEEDGADNDEKIVIEAKDAKEEEKTNLID